MTKNRIIKYLLTLTLILQSVALPNMVQPTVAEAAVQPNVAEAEFGISLKLSNFKTAVMGDSETAVTATYDGKPCWVMDCLKGNASRQINLSFKEDFVSDITAEYKVEVDYFDYGTGYFGYYYDSVESDNRFGQLFYLDNSRKWKTAEFTLSNADFNKGIDRKFDLRLTINPPEMIASGQTISSSSVAISRIKVTRIPGKNPVYVTSDIDESGNSFPWYSKEKIIHNHFTNRTDEDLELNIRYTALSDEDKRLLFDKSEQLTIAAGETVDRDLDISEYDMCNLYDYNVFITNDNISSEFEPLEFCIIKTDPDGIKNRNVYIGTHMWKHENYADGVSVMDKANIGGMRVDVPWWYVEATANGAGNYTLWGTDIGNLIEELLDNNIQVLPLLSSQSFIYARNHNIFPSTQTQLDAFRKYMSYIGEEFAKKGVEYFEIWNEPDVHNGALLDDGVTEMGGASYVPVYNIAQEEIKKANPNAKVMGAATCWASTSDVFLQQAIDAGWADTIDVFSGHPYYRTADEKSVAAQSVIKWKEKIAEAGGPEDIEVWDSECGLTTADDSVGTDKNQANWLTRKCIYMRSMDAGDVIGLFKFEQSGIVAYDREDMYGNARPYKADELFNCKPYTPKISLLQIAAQCYIMADSEPTGIFDKDENVRVYKYKSNKFGKDIISLYSTDTEDVVTLKLDAAQLDYYDEFGNMETIYSDDGIYTFTVDERPMYLVGDFCDPEVVENRFGYSKYVVNSSKNDIASFNVIAPDDTYTVEADFGYGLSLAEKSEFNGGRATVKTAVSLDKDNLSYVTVRIKKDGKTVQKSQIKIVSNEVAVSKLTATLPDTSDLNRWQGEMTIENASQTKAAKGYIQFTYPESFAELKKIDIGIIPRGTTGKATFSLPEIVEKGEYNVNYNIVLDSGEVVSSSVKLDFTVAMYAENKPTIDGIIDKGEWEENSAMYINKESQYKSLIKAQPWRGTNDLSGRFVVEWDEENFYLMADIVDDVHMNDWDGRSTYLGDSLQVGVYYGNQGYIVAGQGATTFHQLTIAKTKDGNDEAYRHLSQDNFWKDEGYWENYECAITRNGNHTYYEFKIPWSSLLKSGQNPIEGNSLGFSAMVNDNDGGGRKGWLEYASGIGETKDTSLFTAIKLIK